MMIRQPYRLAAIFLLSAFITSCLCAPAVGNVLITTSSKVFFEKNGEPYNDPVAFTVTCYGYIVDDTDPDRKNYYSAHYQRREPGTYNQTEVFSYHANVDHYGDEIFEPFYLNLRVIDYCSLCGETNGKKFRIENVGACPGSDCSFRSLPVNYRGDDDICHMATERYGICMDEEDELKTEAGDSCYLYLEKFDKEKIYPPDTKTIQSSEGPLVMTQEYDECIDNACSIDLNCSVFLEDVACEEISDPDGNPIQRDCEFYYEIPADEDGNIIEITPDMAEIMSDVTEATPEPGEIDRNNTEDKVLSAEDFNLLSAILEFFGFDK